MKRISHIFPKNINSFELNPKSHQRWIPAKGNIMFVIFWISMKFNILFFFISMNIEILVIFCPYPKVNPSYFICFITLLALFFYLKTKNSNEEKKNYSKGRVAKKCAKFGVGACMVEWHTVYTSFSPICWPIWQKIEETKWNRK